jgi:16S rRNA G966 N2-methylase RsmD
MPTSEGRSLEHINRQIPPEAHTAMYVWHKYWSRKTWNVVGTYIETYCPTGGIVLDPFAGSGVVAIEAARRNRRAIVCDLNPVANLITEVTLRPLDILEFRRAFERIQAEVRERIEKLYEIHCVKCKKLLVCNAFVREGDRLLEVRYPKCPRCGHRCVDCKPLPSDVEALNHLERNAPTGWYPRNRLYYDGEPFKEKQKYESLDELFTRRNLQALVWLYESIEKETNSHVRETLLAAFTSMVHLCTRMMPVGNPQPTNHYTYFSSPGWTQHSYWSAARYMEQGVWEKFESAVVGHQGVLNAKEEANKVLPKVRITHEWQKVVKGKADIAIVTGDCLKLMKKMQDATIDYVFTDPPYDSSVQYGELSLLWNAWLKRDANYISNLLTQEIIHNERQHKSFDIYHKLISQSFRECFRVLRPDSYLTLTFHNPTFKVRNATVRAGLYAGFDFEKIHHQPLGQVSAKSMIQPFGSAQGDFYLRFRKPKAKSSHKMEEITEERFRRVVIETCREVIAERAEPTPYTILVNYVDPVLARQGFFGTLHSGLDVKTVLEQSLGKEFELQSAKIGGASGKLWWFKDPLFVARLREVPLSERVEKTVFRVLQDKARVTFTEVWDAVSREFPNSLTSDTTSIKQALETYARKVGSTGEWMLREEIRQSVRAHSELIALLAVIGKEQGFDIWVGKPEQGATADGLAGGVRLSTLVTSRPTKIVGVTNLKDVLLMDLLWMKHGAIYGAFEVESTTTMTSALQRGSNLPADVMKVMVLPEERKVDFDRKMQSPMFRDFFVAQGWQLLFFDKFREAFSKSKESTSIDELFGKMSKEPVSAAPVEKQQRLIF